MVINKLKYILNKLTDISLFKEVKVSPSKTDFQFASLNLSHIHPLLYHLNLKGISHDLYHQWTINFAITTFS